MSNRMCKGLLVNNTNIVWRMQLQNTIITTMLNAGLSLGSKQSLKAKLLLIK